jgi:hypothetical protein
VLARWKEHFEEHLNEGSKSEQPPRPFDLRYDGVNIDLPTREERVKALKYLKNNKPAGTAQILLGRKVLPAICGPKIENGV